jgi:hypothetical protein
LLETVAAALALVDGAEQFLVDDEVRGSITGPNGRTARIVTAWKCAVAKTILDSSPRILRTE